MIARAAPPTPTTALTCHAPHADPRKASISCGTQLCITVPGVYAFAGLVARMPAAALADDGHVYHPCPRHSCGAVNRFRVLAVTMR